MDATGAAFVRFALSIGAMILDPRGKTLKSGRVSPYFFNSGVFCDGHSINHLERAFAKRAALFFQRNGVNHQAIYGHPDKGIPLSVLTASALCMYEGINVGSAYSRKEEKDHGEGGLLVGCPLRGKRVVIVDDVMTSGTTCDEAVSLIKKEGGTPIGCVIAFDRQEIGLEGGQSATAQFSARHGIPVSSVATLDDLIKVLRENGNQFDAQKRKALAAILEYKGKYGAR